MNINGNPYDFLNTHALKLETTGAFAAVRELQSTLNAVNLSMGGATVALEEYRKIVAPISESIKAMNLAYAPIFEQTRAFDTVNIKGIISGLQTSASAMSAISELNLSGIASIIDALPKFDFLSDMVTADFSVDVAEKLYESGDITQNDINEEITEIVIKKQFSPKAEWNKIKKSKWFIAIKILIIIATFVCNPVTEYATDKALDSLGITEFWEKSGVYDLIDSIFGNTEKNIVSEVEAKATIDESKTGNISKQKREDLLAKIKEIRSFIAAAAQDENTGNLLSYLSDLEKDVNGKKYGLVFEEHREEIDEVLDTHTPVLTEEKDLFIDNGGQMNFLIEGDNLASLKLLEKTHKGKIDLIYIDPPYNTGAKDFVYDDAFVDATDGFNHSKWLSFMKQRLTLSKKLLAPYGTIFMSIDDNEFSQLKLLCDEVFGANNCVGTILWKKKTNGNNMGWLPPVHDYILCYSKEIEKIYDLGFEVSEEDILKNYSNPDNDPRGPWTTTDLSANHKGPYFPVTNPKTGDVYYPPDGRYWVFNEQEIQRRIADGRIIFGKSGTARPVQRVFAKDRKFSKRKAESWWDNHGMNADATQELKDIFGVAKVFTHPKPTQLIKDIVTMSSSKTATILDFFAGSGTTGHAVMKLNAEDGGSRRFILCTNNENNICRDVTYERIKRVITKEGYAASLKYYKVDYVPISERMYYEYADELLHHIRELVELENGINFMGNAEIAIVLTEEELDDFMANIEAYDKCHKLYMGHNLLPDENQEQSLADHGIEINIIPDYYYQDLQEV